MLAHWRFIQEFLPRPAGGSVWRPTRPSISCSCFIHTWSQGLVWDLLSEFMFQSFQRLGSVRLVFGSGSSSPEIESVFNLCQTCVHNLHF